jgi:hypothetical protein
LTQLERDIDAKIDPRWQESVALSDIAQYLNFKNNKFGDVGDENSRSTRAKHIVDLLGIYELIADNLPAALISPSIYIREWARFISNREAM